MIRTVAVTGATGFIGRHIVETLLAEGFAVRALTRSRPEGMATGNKVWIQGSLEDSASLYDLVHSADAVVHCAGQVKGHSEAVFTQCNVAGSLRLMQAAQNSPTCRRFLFISSLAARYPHLSWYASSKYQAEQRLMAAAIDVALGIFRPTAVYGPGDRALAPVFNGLLQGFLPQLGSDVTQLSFLHVSDLAAAVSNWMQAERPVLSPCELCDGKRGGYSWRGLQLLGAAVRQGPVWRVRIPLPLLKAVATANMLLRRILRQEPMLTHRKIRELIHPNWSASNETISASLPWSPNVSVERALRERLF